MSIILKHQIEFPEAGVTVSNDLFLGTHLIGAKVTANILRDGFGSDFVIELDEMPRKTAQKLFDAKSAGLTVKINLGYFDAFQFKPDLVMEGVVKKIETKSGEGKLKTKITGFEKSTDALQKVTDDIGFPMAGRTEVRLAEVLDHLLALPSVAGAAGTRTTFVPPTLAATLMLDNPQFRGANLLEVIDNLVGHATGGTGRAHMFVYGGALTVGRPLTATDKPITLDPGLNLVKFEPFEKKVAAPEGTNVLEAIPAADVNGFNFTIVGDASVRPMQIVLPLVQDHAAAGIFRIHSVSHRYSTAGYICVGRAVQGSFDTEPDDANAAAATPSGRQIVTGLAKRFEKAAAARPVIETGLVQQLSKGQTQRAQVHYHQRFKSGTAQPSIAADVERDNQRVAGNVPIVSPFAWHKCGLSTPVYPGMKVIMGHNLGKAEDPVALGSIWSDTPKYTQPPADPGDWWLCLPVDPAPSGADGLGPPADSTKATNDLTAKSGERVIETKGLKIRVGAGNLGNIGVRPSPADADTFVIEHSSGTTITIATDGKVTVDASDMELTGNMTVGGNVTVSGTLEVG